MDSSHWRGIQQKRHLTFAVFHTFTAGNGVAKVVEVLFLANGLRGNAQQTVKHQAMQQSNVEAAHGGGEFGKGLIEIKVRAKAKQRKLPCTGVCSDCRLFFSRGGQLINESRHPIASGPAQVNYIPIEDGTRVGGE